NTLIVRIVLPKSSLCFVFLVMLPHPPRTTLFPYTTLFRSTDVLPLVMPLVIYHGKILWSEPKQLRDWFINYDELSEEMTKYVPDFEFTLYDFSYANELNVKGEPKLMAYLQLMQHIFLKDWAKLIQVIVEIETLLLSRGYEKYFNTIILYILRS